MQGTPALRRRLADEIADRHDVRTVAEPSQGLVMTPMRETARGSRFYLGEVLVTEAKAQIDGRIGLGIIAGDDAESAWQLAVIDAAYNAELPETRGWDAALTEEAEVIERRLGEEHARVLETRVDFQTMDVD